METKTLSITLEQAKEYYKTTNDPAFKQLLEDNFGSLLSDGYTWEEAHSKLPTRIYYLSLAEGIGSAPKSTEGPKPYGDELDLPSESKARSVAALIKLIVIAEAYNKDRGEDYWTKQKVSKRFFRAYISSNLQLGYMADYNTTYSNLHFIHSEDIKKSFVKNKELWYDYLEVPISQRN